MLWFSFVCANGFSLWWGGGLREKIQCLSCLCLVLLGCCVFSGNMFLGGVLWVLAVGAGALPRLQSLFISMNLEEHWEHQRQGSNDDMWGYCGLPARNFLSEFPGFKPTSWGTKLCWGFLKSLYVKSGTLCMSFARHWQNDVYFQQQTSLKLLDNFYMAYLFNYFIYILVL